MAVLSPIVSRLRLDISEFTAGMARVASRMNTYTTTTTESLNETNKQLTSHRLQLKDTARIVQGIMISQVFYGITRAISDATSALWEFNEELDYARISYSALFGNSNIATDFLNVLQEHAIDTIFTFQDLTESSKKLLAYGIDYENLMFVIEGLTNLGAMSGDTAALDRIALALGQVYTKGKLSAEEMRQLANAYIPITEIITEKFGLSGDDLERVGDLNLPAADVINAIVDYANENFANVGDSAMMTLTGLESRIADTAKVLGVEALKPLTSIYKSFLLFVSKGLEGIRAAYASGGIGGIFEHLVPDEGTQTVIRQFIANLKNLFMSLASVGAYIKSIFGNMFHVFTTAFNIVVPTITAVTNALFSVLNAMLQTQAGTTALRIALSAAAAAFFVLKVHALSSLVVTAVTKAVLGLTKALAVLATVISKHPILMLISLIGVGLLSVAASSDKANEAISKLFNGVSKATGGYGVEDTLQKVDSTLQSSADAADQFNNRLKAGANAASELSDSISGAGKSAKKTKDTLGLLSFDEVFKLPEQSEASSDSTPSYGGLLGDLNDLTNAFNGIEDALNIDVPDFSEIIDSFKDGLVGPLNDLLPDSFSNTWLGGIIGGLKGAGLMGAVKNLIKSLFTKAGLKDLIGRLIVSYADDGVKGIAKALVNGLATGLKGVNIAKMLKGTIIGAIIGLIVDGIAGLLWDTLEEEFENANAETARLGSTVGSLLGTIIGVAVGGPVGAVVGSIIGTFVAGFVGLFWEPIKQFFIDTADSISDWAAGIFEDLSAWWDNTFGGFFRWCAAVTFAIFEWLINTKDTFSTWWNDTFGGFFDWWSDTKKGFSDWFTDTKNRISDWLTKTVKIFSDWDSINGDTLVNWWNDTKKGFTKWSTETKAKLITWATDTLLSINSWWTNTKETFTTWSMQTVALIVGWAKTVVDKFTEWADKVLEKIVLWHVAVITAIADWAIETRNKITLWVAETIVSFVNWARETKAKVIGWCETVGKVIGGFGISVKEAIKKWFEDRIKAVTDWLNNLGLSISNWFTNRIADVKTWFANLFNVKNWSTGWNLIYTWFTVLKTSISNWFSSRIADVKTWFANLFNVKNWSTGWNLIYTWFTVLKTSISDWFTNRIADVKTWFANLFNVKNWSTGWNLIYTWFTVLKTSISDWFTNRIPNVKTWFANLFNVKNWSTGWSLVSGWYSALKTSTSSWFSSRIADVKGWWATLFDTSKWKSAWSLVSSWFTNLKTSISSWFSSLATSVSTWWSNLWDGKEVTASGSGSTNYNSKKFQLEGHAVGGIFTKEHIARFAEGGKAEAVIPLENQSAMQPFVDAISSGLLQNILPSMSTAGSSSNGLPPMYVGTLIADERGLQELFKKFEVYEAKELARKGAYA